MDFGLYIACCLSKVSTSMKLLHISSIRLLILPDSIRPDSGIFKFKKKKIIYVMSIWSSLFRSTTCYLMYFEVQNLNQ